MFRYKINLAYYITLCDHLAMNNIHSETMPLNSFLGTSPQTVDIKFYKTSSGASVHD